MHAPETQSVDQVYQAKFGNLDELAAPEILFEPAFSEMLQAAVSNGRKLTRRDVEKKFPQVAGWGEVVE